MWWMIWIAVLTRCAVLIYRGWASVERQFVPVPAPPILSNVLLCRAGSWWAGRQWKMAGRRWPTHHEMLISIYALMHCPCQFCVRLAVLVFAMGTVYLRLWKSGVFIGANCFQSGVLDAWCPISGRRWHPNWNGLLCVRLSNQSCHRLLWWYSYPRLCSLIARDVTITSGCLLSMFYHSRGDCNCPLFSIQWNLLLPIVVWIFEPDEVSIG